MQPPAGIIRPLTDRTSIQPGEKFTITVQAEDISSLFGLAFILSCESGGYLTPLDCSQGAFFADGSLFYYHMDTDNIAVALSRKAGETSLSGEGQLCTVRFAASSDIPEDMPVMFELRDITAGNGTGETVSLKSDPLTLNIESDAVDVASDETAQPVEFGMRQNYPNPFNSETVIEYSLPRTLDTSLIIYNLSGQNIRVLVDGEISSGKHIVAWNGRDEYGRSVGAGVYICWMRAGTFTETRRMLYLP